MPPDASATMETALRSTRGRVDAADAELLLLHVLQRPRAWLFAHATELLPAASLQRYESLLERRANGEPVAYLLGRRGFWTFELDVTTATLIPRPETELLVEQALMRVPGAAIGTRVADLGTGSGAIALAIATERPLAGMIATDASIDALAVAEGNARRLGIGNVEFRHGDWWAPLAGERFDAIVSNPPYIEDGDPHLLAGDLRFEPRGALTSGPDGLDAIRCIVDGATDHLVPSGWLLLEHGWEQGEAVRALFQAAGFTEVATLRDLEERDRVTLGRQKG